MAAALKGAKEIGFTLISLTLSIDCRINSAVVYGRCRGAHVP